MSRLLVLPDYIPVPYTGYAKSGSKYILDISLGSKSTRYSRYIRLYLIGYDVVKGEEDYKSDFSSSYTLRAIVSIPSARTPSLPVA